MASEKELTNAPQIKEMMYSQPLNKEQVDSILDNFTDLKILYHTTTAGLRFQNNSLTEDTPLLFFKGRGEVTDITSAELKKFMSDFPTHAIYLYELFSKGILTFEQFENPSIFYEEYFQNQEDIEASSGAVQGQFNNDGVFINTGTGGSTI